MHEIADNGLSKIIPREVSFWQRKTNELHQTSSGLFMLLAQFSATSVSLLSTLACRAHLKYSQKNRFAHMEQS
jgi:hypothetical protein